MKTSPSPFHRGEQALQTRLGVREKMERFGRQVIRDHLPAQHQDFYQQLPFILAGHADHEGWPWASILFNKPGFIDSPDAGHLQLHTQPVDGDPLKQSLQPGLPVGLLGIDLQSRRRNRIAGRVVSHSDEQFSIAVQQVFGNCPQYIQTRQLEYVDQDTSPADSIQHITQLDADARALIANSDTFFVASYVASGNQQASDGVDVSHRGGKPGFVRVDASGLLTIPDYAGNLHFNTLGNFVETPRAGLLFVDFENGHLLTLTGRVEILWDSEETEFFAGAERLWTFTLDHGCWLRNALPLRWKLDDYSPNTELTGTWKQAADNRQAHAQRTDWLEYEVSKIVDESQQIRSFHLRSLSGNYAQFEAGQFLTIRAEIEQQEMIRTYTVSSAPGEEGYRISVKRDGVFSSYLHTQIKVGDRLQAQAPQGGFTFDASVKRPAVLIAAGVGITPMLAMARHAMIEGFRHRSYRPLTLIHAARNQTERAFYQELRQLAQGGHLRSLSVLSQPEAGARIGVDYDFRGHIDAELLSSILPLDDYDFYLCGPNGFMQSIYDDLQSLGVQDRRVFAESFGPSSLQRVLADEASPKSITPVAEAAIIEFSETQMEQQWTADDGSLLELAEAHGLTPPFSCRSGQCGTCRTPLLSGSVTYLQPPSYACEADEVLICCARPAASADEELPRVILKL